MLKELRRCRRERTSVISRATGAIPRATIGSARVSTCTSKSNGASRSIPATTTCAMSFCACWHGLGSSVRQCRTQWVDTMPHTQSDIDLIAVAIRHRRYLGFRRRPRVAANRRRVLFNRKSDGRRVFLHSASQAVAEGNKPVLSNYPCTFPSPAIGSILAIQSALADGLRLDLTETLTESPKKPPAALAVFLQDARVPEP